MSFINIIDADDHFLEEHEKFGYCTDVDISSEFEEGNVILTILFTPNGSDRYPLTLRFDKIKNHLDDFLWQFGGFGGLVELKRGERGHIHVTADTYLRHCLHCGLHQIWDTW